MPRTRFTDEYGVEVPVVSAGMAFISRAELVIAVARGGGFGTLGATGMPPELLEDELARIRAEVTAPFGVNFIARFSEESAIDICCEHQVAAVAFHWDPPPAAWIERLHEQGVRIWMQVGSVAEAVTAIDAGIDAVIAQGSEAGGHNRSSAGVMALVPNVVDAVGPALVLAAGGIADGRGVAAALTLGADAAVLGTRYVASAEADAHDDYKQRIVDAGVDATAHHWIFGFDFPDAPVRGLRNTIVEEWQGRDQPPPYEGLDPAEQPVIGTASVFGAPVPLARFVGIPPTRGTTGDFDSMSLLAGESVGLIHSVRSAEELTRELGIAADEALRRTSAP